MSNNLETEGIETSVINNDNQCDTCFELYVSYLYGNREQNFGGQIIKYPTKYKLHPETVKQRLLEVDPSMSTWHQLYILAWSKVEQ